MKRICLALLLLLLPITSLLAQRENQGVLRILDKENNEPLIGVLVTFPKNHVHSSNIDGDIFIPKDVAKDALIQLNYLGYQSKSIRLRDLKGKSPYRIYMTMDNRTINTCYVTAQKKALSVATVSSKISMDKLAESVNKSLAKILDKTSGVSMIQTGANTAKPVIHGMHGNRILIVNNGVRQSGQQWGDAHAPELDFSGSNIIHIVKGAEAVRYGSEAMGGVILMEQTPLAYQEKRPKGSLNNFYASNGQAFGSNLLIEGAIPFAPNLAYRLEGKYHNSGDHSTANYLLNNTGHRLDNIITALGCQYKKLTIEAFYTRFHEKTGVLPTARLGGVEQLLERIELGQPTEADLKPFSRSISYPYETVQHQTLLLRANYNDLKWGKLKYQISFQDDRRREYRTRRNNNSHIPELALNLKTWSQNLQWEKRWSQVKLETGFQTSSKNNYSIPNNGISPIIPNYRSMEWGVYGLAYYSAKKWNLELGFRYDGQRIKAASYDKYGEYYYDDKTYHCLTYSLGGRYKLNRYWTLVSNFGLAWRPPHVFELYSDGVQHGAGAYIKGNKELDSERGYKWISSLAYQDNTFHIQLSAYAQWIRNFIYDQAVMNKDNTPMIRREISGDYPIFAYRQTDAFFRGADLDIDINLTKNWHYSTRATLVLANEDKTNDYLPHIPPVRIDQELRWSKALSEALTLNLGLGHRYVFKQNRFDPHKDLIDYTPDAYQLWNLSSKLSWQINHRFKLDCSLSAENLLNKEYKEYTNRARYYAHDLGRNIQATCSLHF